MEKRTPLEPHQRRLAHLALRAARKAAGFKSASAAAEGLGFAKAKYRAQEAGARSISLEDAQRYAAAFGVSPDALTKADPSDIDRELHHVALSQQEASQKTQREIQETSQRLKLARLARGFRSARQAAKTFALIIPTYLKHEAAESSLSASVIRLYSAIFGINDSWLRHGELPSGLGPELDVELQRGIDPEEFVRVRHLASPYSPPSEGVLATLKAELQAKQVPKWTENAGDVIREIEEIDLRRGGLDALHVQPSRFWPLPKGFVRDLFSTSIHNLVSIVRDGAQERLFVDVTKTNPHEGGEYVILREDILFLWSSRQPSASPPDGAEVVGRILAKFLLSIPPDGIRPMDDGVRL